MKMKDCILVTLPNGNPLFVIEISDRNQVTDLFIMDKVEKWYNRLHEKVLVENVNIGHGFTGIQVTVETRKTLISWDFYPLVK